MRLRQEQCLIAKWPKRLCNLGGNDWYGKDAARSRGVPQRQNGGTRRCAGCDTVIHKDDRGAERYDRGLPTHPQAPPALALLKLPVHLLCDEPGWHTEALDYLVVQHCLRWLSIYHGAKREFRLTWRTNLADQQQVKRNSQCLRDRQADWHTATRQREHHRVRSRKVSQALGQAPAGLGAVAEPYDCFLPPEHPPTPMIRPQHHAGAAGNSILLRWPARAA